MNDVLVIAERPWGGILAAHGTCARLQKPICGCIAVSTCYAQIYLCSRTPPSRRPQEDWGFPEKVSIVIRNEPMYDQASDYNF